MEAKLRVLLMGRKEYNSIGGHLYTGDRARVPRTFSLALVRTSSGLSLLLQRKEEELVLLVHEQFGYHRPMKCCLLKFGPLGSSLWFLPDPRTLTQAAQLARDELS